MPYWRLHYHLVWATYKRLPLLADANRKLLYGTLYGKADELRAIIHALGNVEDHIHVVVSIPPKIAIVECVKHFKGASSREITRVLGEDFQWQAGYGALSLGGRSLPIIKRNTTARARPFPCMSASRRMTMGRCFNRRCNDSRPRRSRQ